MPSEPGLVAAIVLARGGSKGLPRKNVLPIAGKPCVRWTIDQALDAGTTDLVVVSSDDAEVLSIAADARARTHLRGPELASDTATVDAAARCAATDLEADTLVILYGNVPVRPADLIDRAVRALGATGADSVQSFARVGKHHPWWTARLDEATGLVGPWEGDRLNHGVHRRQDLPPAYIPDGGVIALTRDALFRRIERVE
ncbi:MAG: acylneuraminate cytidylyltransferase family protein, partial [Planctomycetota bacterium]